ncbi:glutaminyl-tRNA synthetase [Enteropsectra breve]|nr:glutaminyl-tRNA synthetase [Enteropsectra breve]
MMSSTDLLESINIPREKIDELLKKPQIVRNIETVAKCSQKFSKLHYSLICTAPKNVDICKIVPYIENGMIKHENMLRGVYKFMEGTQKMTVEEFIRQNDVSPEEIENKIREKCKLPKAEILKNLKKEIPFADAKIILEQMSKLNISEASTKKTSSAEEVSEYKWLEEGEISMLHMPGENPQVSDAVRDEHLKRTGGKVVTRFPPEPNGNLHIGHAKALNLSFNYAKKFGGYTYLRFDDTNPKKEKEEHFENIQEDIRWLGFEPQAITASSDHFDWMNEKSVELIRKGKAYVCHCTVEDMRNRRQVFQRERDGGNFDPTILSPYRNRSVEENIEEFNKMMDGKYEDGEATLRFKMDLESKNPLMLDLVGSRIMNIVHPQKNRNYHVYPSYEFALCVCDSLEDVTHSFCSREFKTRQEPYHWLLQNLEMYEPVQWEFSRLNLSNTVLSKRKMTEIVNMGLEWDDPRFYTIRGMRRRGFTANAINKFVQSVGITFSETTVDVRILENFVRKDLEKEAKKMFCIRNPLKVTINGLSKRTVEIPSSIAGGENEKIEVNKFIYIDGSDFEEKSDVESTDGEFMRLTPKQPVGLIGIGTISYLSKNSDGIVCELVDEKPLKYCQWVPNLNNKVELRLYKPLFNSFSPDEVGYLSDLNLNSIEKAVGYCDARIKTAKNLEKYQFVRMGFFCCDKDSTDSNLVFNLTLPLRGKY